MSKTYLKGMVRKASEELCLMIDNIGEGEPLKLSYSMGNEQGLIIDIDVECPTKEKAKRWSLTINKNKEGGK